MRKSLEVQFNDEEVVSFYSTEVIPCTVGGVEGTLIFVPNDAMKPLKEKLDPETGEVIPSKGVRASVGAKNGDGWGMAFQGQYGLQLSLMHLNTAPKARERVFADDK